MTVWRSRVAPWVPPAVIAWAARRTTVGNVFTEFPGSWADATAAVSGYSDPSIIAKVAEATRAVERGTAAFERDSVLFASPEYSWPLLAALMHAGARDGRLSVLDFGGALGSTYRQHRTFLDDLPHLVWTVVEQPDFVDIGRAEFQTDILRFVPTIAAAVDENAPTVVLLGSSLQYLEHPRDVLAELAQTGAHTLIVDRTPLSASPEDRLTIQQVPEEIYRAAYPMWVLSRSSLLGSLAADLELRAEYVSGHGVARTAGGLEFGWDGLILERR